MNKLNLLRLVCFTISVVMLLPMSAQVSIGSGVKPVTGVLLDLKERNDATALAGGDNSDRGLGLPRVKLTVSNALTDIPEATGTGYEGLMVYNVGEEGGMCPGLHVWDGSTWVALGGNTGMTDITMTDADGNVYNAKWFSTETPCQPDARGAYFTTSNLYTTKNKTGEAFLGGARLNPVNSGAITINSTSDFTGNVAYGQDVASIVATNKILSMKDYAAKFGLSYTHAQAMDACPKGWHLPTDEDWNQLADALGGVSVAGAAMRANNDYYLADGQSTSFKWGSSDVSGTRLSGFNALPSGSVDANGSSAVNFSNRAFWWSATKDNGFWNMRYNNSSLLMNAGGVGNYFSVRCVKNEESA